MEPPARALEVLTEAESQMRRLIEESVRVGQYHDVVVMARIADRLSALRAGDTEAGSRTEADDTAPATPGTDVPRSHPRKAVPAGRRKGYPRFSITGDEVSKISWSKKLKGEYEHRASRQSVEAVLKVIAEASQQRDVVAVADLLPLRSGRGAGEVPMYQVYVALGWLKSIGVVRQHGRQGYSVPEVEASAQRMTIEWARAKRQFENEALSRAE